MLDSTPTEMFELAQTLSYIQAEQAHEEALPPELPPDVRSIDDFIRRR